MLQTIKTNAEAEIMIKRDKKKGNPGTEMLSIKSRDKTKKIMLSCAAAFLLLALYCVIFSFSAQDGEESGSISIVVSKKCVETFNVVAKKNWTDSMVEKLAESFEHPVRKLAHFSEYAVMGILVYGLWAGWIHSRRKLCLLAGLWVVVSACADEFHQYFIPGRCGSPADVLLDTCGGLFGVLVCVLAAKWLGRKKL